MIIIFRGQHLAHNYCNGQYNSLYERTLTVNSIFRQVQPIFATTMETAHSVNTTLGTAAIMTGTFVKI